MGTKEITDHMGQDRKSKKILKPRGGLIPRNNWDYGAGALLSALAHVRADITHAPNAEAFFQQIPIWTTSGRASLYAILKSLGLPPGSQVGVPLFCCSVVFNAIQQAGLVPCFVDSNLEDCNLSVADLRRKRGGMKAMVVVHMFGRPCDMDAILEAADSLPVIEDCAQSIFSTYKGRQTGGLSTASFFSFRCGKYISAGEGSVIICRSPELRQKIERTVNSFDGWPSSSALIHALSTFVKAALYNRPWYGWVGHPIGMRLDKKLNLTAKDGFEARKIAPTHLALIDERLAHFEKQIEIQREHAQTLLASLTPEGFCLPPQSEDAAGNWFQFALRFPGQAQRDRMADHLLRCGIDTAKYLDTIAEEARLQYGYQGDCPQAERLSKTILLVPIHYTLKARDIEYIASSINDGARAIGKEEGAVAALSTL